MAIAPVLKTGGRKPLGVRIPRSPQVSLTVFFLHNLFNTLCLYVHTVSSILLSECNLKKPKSENLRFKKI
jgi:hypothetical protein